ncbi:MAG: iron-containing alcohol dehydrogenase [Nitratireductor sp.]|nr:iron-containing alcohol dehydrogenase [Nitratireductor sp.]
MAPSVQIGTATHAQFGEGSRQALAGIVSIHPAPKVLIVASASSLRRAEIAALRTVPETFGPVVVWDRVSPNPRTGDIDDCLATHGDACFTHVIGIGGGSALDQAKATAMALHCNEPVTELLRRKSMPRRSNCLILIPTTSGTGSELSYGAILTNQATGEKLGLRGATVSADYALVDPELTWGVPIDISMVTGFDVLTHALETWLSLAATPYTRDLSRGAIERVFRWLPVVHGDPTNATARREMAYASMVMGINLALSTTCLPHRLQYPIGAATDTAHAAGLAAIYPAWLDHVLPFALDRLAECADWIGVAHAADTETRARAFVKAVTDLLVRIELTDSLQDLGVTAEMIARFPAEVSGRLDTDPGYCGREDLAAIYDRAWAAGLPN